MKNTIDTAAIESLRDFAIVHERIAFSHLCTSALAGEEWAQDRIDQAIDRVPASAGRPDWHTILIGVIDSTDCTRPDGATARSVEV